MSFGAVTAKLSPLAAPTSLVKQLAVAVIRVSKDVDTWPHAGVLYRWKKDIRLFHMLGHQQVEDRAAPPKFGLPATWVEPSVEVEQAQMIASRCRMMAKVQAEDPQAFPYGFRFRATVVDRTGRLVLGPGETGVTCSTIVAAAFADEGCPLVDLEGWPDADQLDIDDRERFLNESLESQEQKHEEAMKEVEAKPPEGERHSSVLRREISSPRVRPQDVVAGAALLPPVRRYEEVCLGAGAVDLRLSEAPRKTR